MPSADESADEEEIGDGAEPEEQPYNEEEDNYNDDCLRLPSLADM